MQIYHIYIAAWNCNEIQNEPFELYRCQHCESLKTSVTTKATSLPDFEIVSVARRDNGKEDVIIDTPLNISQ